MPFHVRLWQFDPNGKTLYHQHDPRAFESDLVRVAPGQGIEEVRGMWAKDDAADCGDRSFTNVQALFNEERDEHEEGCEASDDEVCPMGLVDRKLIPGHLEDWLVKWILSDVQLPTISLRSAWSVCCDFPLGS